MSERSRIELLRSIFSKETKNVSLAIGDDAAVLASPSDNLIWTVDEQVERTHFKLDLMTPYDVGWRSVMAAASDLAAMGAKPWCALASLVLPKSFSEESFEAIAHGQRDACDVLSAMIIGGNLARGEAISITTTWLGTTNHPITRSGAKSGDGVYVAGELGLAAAGLEGLRRGIAVPESALSAFRRPRALIDAGLQMHPLVTAAIDVSDGLAGDADHIANASRVRLVFDRDRLLAAASPSLLEAAKCLGREPLDLILNGGEDYALLCTSPQDLAGFTRVGEIQAGDGVWLNENAAERRLSGGFDHFA